MKDTQSQYNLIIGILAHLLLTIYSIFFIKKSIKNKTHFTENVLFIIGHIFIIINLVKTMIEINKNTNSDSDSDSDSDTNYKNMYLLKKNNKNDIKEPLLYHSIGHLFLFLFGILLTINEYNKISKVNNGFNIIYTLNQLLFTIVLFMINYNIIENEKVNIINFIILLIFIVFIIYKIDISYKSNSFFFNKIPLYGIIIYLISMHGSLL